MKIAVIGARGLPPNPLKDLEAHTQYQAQQSVTRSSAATSGIEHYCAEMYPRIASEGHSVDLFARSSYTQKRWYFQSIVKGVNEISLPCLHLRGADALVSSALGAVSTLFSSYDIVHFHALGPALFSGLPLLSRSAKVVVTCHGLDWQRVKWGKLSSRLIRLGEETAARYAHEIIVVSTDLQEYFWKTYGRETVYIPNAPATYVASDSSFQFGSSLGLQKNRYLLFLGRLVPEKAPDLLIQAFQKLQPQGWKLVLVGKSSDTSSFTSSLLGLANSNANIVFTGELSGRYLAEVVRGAGLFVLPSSLEGMPLSMLEAMQEGIPVLGSDIPPHQQLIGEDRGITFQTGNLDSFVHQMDWAICHPKEMNERAERAEEYIRLNYQWERIVADTIQLYKFMSRDRKHSRSTV
jgi:glycosyltransferase involved in cell wall biosynthesis